ncbi:MAG: T9SS type A sorting domain-containing protein [Chloroherpetonaceae bacterium]
MGKISPHPVGTEGATLDFSIGSDGQTTIRILNSNGALVSVLVDGLMRAGDYNARIPVEKLVSGVYFIEMQSGEFKEVQKIVVQK